MQPVTARLQTRRRIDPKGLHHNQVLTQLFHKCRKNVTAESFLLHCKIAWIKKWEHDEFKLQFSALLAKSQFASSFCETRAQGGYS